MDSPAAAWPSAARAWRGGAALLVIPFAVMSGGCGPREELVATDPGPAEADGGVVTLLGDRRPQQPVDQDPKSVEVGVKIRTAVTGDIEAVRFFRSVPNPRGYVAKVWSLDGKLLASQVVPGDEREPPGWRVATLPAPVSVLAGSTFVVSYFADAGLYHDDQYGISRPIRSGPLTAPAEGELGPNGVYVYTGVGAFPSHPWRASNYWVDVVFRPRS
jgi:hypothetical protein